MRRNFHTRLFCLVGTMLSLCMSPAVRAAPLPLATVANVPLPGGTSRFDYQSLDANAHRLFISHMGAGRVVVFNTATRRVIADLRGFPEATGVTVAPGLHRVFVSVTGHWWDQAFFGGSVAVLNSVTLKTLARIPAGTFPDGSAYVPSVERLFVSDELGRTETVIDTVTSRRIATLPLGSEAGMTAYDPVSGHVLVNLQSSGVLAAIDPVADRVVARYPLPATCHHNHGLLLDVPSRLAFIACDHNARLLVMNLHTMRITEVHRVGRDPDVLAMDFQRKRLYVASESGIVAVFRITKGGLRKLGEGYVGDDAHSVAVDPTTGLVYFPIKNFHGKPILKIMRYATNRETSPISAKRHAGKPVPVVAERVRQVDEVAGAEHRRIAALGHPGG